MSEDTCRTCRFWGARHPIHRSKEYATRLNCQRHAPVVVEDRQRGKYTERFPIRQYDDWCGDHEPGMNPEELRIMEKEKRNDRTESVQAQDDMPQ